MSVHSHWSFWRCPRIRIAESVAYSGPLPLPRHYCLKHSWWQVSLEPALTELVASCCNPVVAEAAFICVSNLGKKYVTTAAGCLYATTTTVYACNYSSSVCIRPRQQQPMPCHSHGCMCQSACAVLYSCWTPFDCGFVLQCSEHQIGLASAFKAGDYVRARCYKVSPSGSSLFSSQFSSCLT